MAELDRLDTVSAVVLDEPMDLEATSLVGTQNAGTLNLTATSLQSLTHEQLSSLYTQQHSSTSSIVSYPLVSTAHKSPLESVLEQQTQLANGKMLRFQLVSPLHIEGLPETLLDLSSTTQNLRFEYSLEEESPRHRPKRAPPPIYRDQVQ